MSLSKSQYCRGIQCRKSLWLYRNRKDLQSEPGAMLQMIFDQGHLVGELACKRFPGGTPIEEDHTRPAEAVESTEKAVRGGAKILYEAGTIFDDVLIRADILKRNRDKTWDLIEVKSSTGVKDVYLHDLAIQRYVLEGAGYKIRRTLLMHINNEYIREGAIDVRGLFTLSDETLAVSELGGEVEGRVKLFHEVVAKEKVPDIAFGAHCANPYPCDFMDHCWRDVPEDSVFGIGGIYKSKAQALWESGIELIEDIPEEYKLSKKQLRQVSVVKTGESYIEPKKIRLHLDRLVYPLYFLDFETVNPAVPPYEGLRPFQNLPFQASVHVQKKVDAEVTHHDLLVEPDRDPRPEMAAFLTQAIGSKGSVIAYNMSFEAGCLARLAEACPEQAKKILSIKPSAG